MPRRDPVARREYERSRKPPSPHAQRVLEDLVRISFTRIGVATAKDVAAHPWTLMSLEKRRLARRVDEDLWRASLGGVAAIRMECWKEAQDE